MKVRTIVLTNKEKFIGKPVIDWSGDFTHQFKIVASDNQVSFPVGALIKIPRNSIQYIIINNK